MMTEVFSGPWSVEVVRKHADFSERFVISGSDGSDGLYDAVPGFRIDVTGDTWRLDLEWNDNAGSGWRRSAVRRSAENTIGRGLVVTLGADDNVEALRDHDLDDVILGCRSLDPALDAPVNDPPLDFSIKEDMLRPPDES